MQERPQHPSNHRWLLGTISIALAATAWVCIGYGIDRGINHDLGTPHWAEAALLCTLLGCVTGVIAIRSTIGKIGFGISLSALLAMVFVG